MGNLQSCCAGREREDKINQIMETCKQTGKPYYDSDFPASKESLIHDWMSNDPEIKDLVPSW